MSIAAKELVEKYREKTDFLVQKFSETSSVIRKEFELQRFTMQDDNEFSKMLLSFYIRLSQIFVSIQNLVEQQDFFSAAILYRAALEGIAQLNWVSIEPKKNQIAKKYNDFQEDKHKYWYKSIDKSMCKNILELNVSAFIRLLEKRLTEDGKGFNLYKNFSALSHWNPIDVKYSLTASDLLLTQNPKYVFDLANAVMLFTLVLLFIGVEIYFSHFFEEQVSTEIIKNCRKFYKDFETVLLKSNR